MAAWGMPCSAEVLAAQTSKFISFLACSSSSRVGAEDDAAGVAGALAAGAEGAGAGWDACCCFSASNARTAWSALAFMAAAWGIPSSAAFLAAHVISFACFSASAIAALLTPEAGTGAAAAAATGAGETGMEVTDLPPCFISCWFLSCINCSTAWSALAFAAAACGIPCSAVVWAAHLRSLTCFSSSMISSTISGDDWMVRRMVSIAAGDAVVGPTAGAGAPPASCCFSASTARTAWSALAFIAAAWGIPSSAAFLAAQVTSFACFSASAIASLLAARITRLWERWPAAPKDGTGETKALS
mmetsp:Transcript_175545/g.562980  ORF Transcript_175545/g.562980 Transcript_175545/m.562980 type:complete len:301 (+) Transcript_175545:183-1085(+)